MWECIPKINLAGGAGASVEGKVDSSVDFPLPVCFSQTHQYCHIYSGTCILSRIHTFIIYLSFLINLIPNSKAQVEDHDIS